MVSAKVALLVLRGVQARIYSVWACPGMSWRERRHMELSKAVGTAVGYRTVVAKGSDE